MDKEYGGPERRTRIDDIHKFRWMLLTLWIIGFTFIVLYSIHKVQNDSANVQSLQKTNCKLSLSLLQARKTRWDTYKKTHDKVDLQSVIGYEKLVDPFINEKKSVGHCPIPNRLQIQGRTITVRG